MLIRIDIPPQHICNNGSQEQKSGSSENPFTTYYACLGTARHHQHGTLIKVGRKNSDISFSSERSVSRSHCAIRLISLDAKVQEEDSDETKDGDDQEENAAGPPNGEDEVEACKASVDGLAVVLEDLNSKFGTFIYVDKEDTKQTSTSTGDNSETDEETDDEGAGMQMSAAHSQSQSPLLSTCPEWTKNKTKKQVEGKLILNSLTLLKTYSRDSDTSLSVSFQCGTVLLRLTRVPLDFCHTRLSSAEKTNLQAMSSKIGAITNSSYNVSSTSHLITPDRQSTAKTICAWAQQVPIVKISFVEALLGRNSLTDDMPQVEDHIPPGTLPMDELDLKSSDDPLSLFKAYKILSLQHSEGEILAKCGGATIIQLYKKGTNGKLDLTFWKNDEWWEALKQEQIEDKLVVVWLDCESKKVKKGREYLLKKTQSEKADGKDGLNIGMTTQRSLAVAMSNLGVLKDSEENELHPISSSSADLQSHNPIDDSDVGDLESQYKPMSEDEKDPTESLEETETFIERVRYSQRGSRDIKNIRDLSTSKSQETSTSEWISSQRHPMKDIEDTVVNSRANEEEDINDSYATESSPTQDLGGAKKKLRKADNGWFVAAPKGKKRAAYKRKVDFDGKPLPESAETEVSKSLLVRDFDEDRKDFKKFKKNNIIPGSHAVAPIRLRSVLPKESERQRQLLASEQELEREQRVADSLFAGEDRSKQRKLPSKRGRGRRRV